MIRLTAAAQTKTEIGRLLDLVEELAHPTPAAMRPFQDGVRAGFAVNFASEGRGAGAPWASLALVTMRERRRLGYPPDHPILVRSGGYRDSFVDESHPLHISEADSEGGVWRIVEGSSDPRADELEYGRWNMFPRPATILGERGEARLDEIAAYVFDQWFEGE